MISLPHSGEVADRRPAMSGHQTAECDLCGVRLRVGESASVPCFGAWYVCETCRSNEELFTSLDLGKVTHLIFEFDGVILDSLPGRKRVWQDCLVRYNVSRNASARILENLSNGKAGMEIVADAGLETWLCELLRSQNDRIWAKNKTSLDFFPGVVPALAKLAGTYTIGITTSSNRDYVSEMLKKNGVLGHISAIAAGDDIAHSRPHVETLEYLLNRMPFQRRQAILIGGSEAVLRLARNGGIPFIPFGTDPQARAKTHVGVDNWTQLLALLT